MNQFIITEIPSYDAEFDERKEIDDKLKFCFKCRDYKNPTVKYGYNDSLCQKCFIKISKKKEITSGYKVFGENHSCNRCKVIKNELFLVSVPVNSNKVKILSCGECLDD